jgi:hypothetical protein
MTPATATTSFHPLVHRRGYIGAAMGVATVATALAANAAFPDLIPVSVQETTRSFFRDSTALATIWAAGVGRYATSFTYPNSFRKFNTSEKLSRAFNRVMLVTSLAAGIVSGFREAATHIASNTDQSVNQMILTGGLATLVMAAAFVVTFKPLGAGAATILEGAYDGMRKLSHNFSTRAKGMAVEVVSPFSRTASRRKNNVTDVVDLNARPTPAARPAP